MIMSCYNEIRTRDTAYSLAKGSPQNDNEVQFAERLRRIPGFIGHFSAISKWTPFTFYVHSCLPPDSLKYDYPKVRLQDQSGIAMETINSVQQSSFMGKWSEVRTKMGNFEIPVDMVPPHIAAFAERFVMLAYSLWRAKDIEDIIQTIMWFSLSMTEQSIAMKIVDYVREILTEDQFSGMSLLETIKSTRDDWTAVTASPLFDQISQLLSCMVALGICTATTVDFDIKGVKLFAVASRSSQYNAATLMQATLDSLVFFLEGGYLCFQKGSFRPLLCSDTEVEKFLESYDQVIMKSKLVRGGNLERLGYGTEAEYDKQLQDLILSTAILTKSCNAKSEKMMLEKKLSEIKNLKVDFQQFKNTEGLREAPWCVGIYGNSSVGKSSLTQIIISAILHSQNLPCTQDYTYTLKSNDAYMSGYKSYFQAIIYDDMGNTKPNFVKNAPTEPLIDIVNNVRYFANMAELELKGKVSVEPKVVVVTKNPKDGGASHYSMEPVSIARRERFLIKPTPRKKFTTNNMLDSDKIMDYYGKIPSFPDAWTFDVQQAYPIIQENGPAEVGYMTVAVGINLMQLMSIFYEDSARFYVAQASLVANANNLPKAIKEKSCTSCRRLFQCCICNDKPDLCGTTCFKCEMPVELCACESGPVEQSMIFPTVDVKELIQLEGVPDTLYNQPNIEPLDDKPDVENQTGSLFEWAFGIWCAKKLSGIRKMKEWMTKVEDVTTTTLEKNLKTMERSIPLFLLGLLPETWTDGYVTQWLFDHLYDKTITRINSLNKILFYTQMGGMVSLIDWGSLFTKGLTDPKGLSLLIPGTACVIMGSLLQAAFVGTEEEETVIETRNKMWGIGGVISMTILPWSTSIPVYGRALGMLSFSALGNMYLFKVQKGMRRAFEHESTGLRVTARSIRQRVKTSLQTKCMVAAGILTAIKMYKMYASTRISEQGKLNPFSIKDIWKRDEEVNVWKQPVLSKIPVHPKLKNMTHDQVIEKVFSNLCYFEARRKKLIGTTAVGYCDALFICSNVALIPYHIFKEGTDMKCTFYRHGPDTVGGTFHHLMTEDTIYRIPNTDFCLVWVPSGGDWADIRHLLSGTNPEAGPASIVYKTDEGEKEITNTFAKFRELTPTYCTYYGGEYEFLSNKRPSGTFNGLCMATLVSQKRDNQIIGFHLAGRGTYGVCGVLTKSQCDAAIECLGSKEGVVLSCSSGTMPTDQYGVNFEYKAEIHPKSPVNFLEKGNFSMYGSIRGRTKAFSQVRVSSLSEHILTVCGVPNKWGPPNFKQGGTNYPFQASLVHSSDPMSFVPLPLLNAAKNDYIEGILYKMNSIPESKDHLRPLSNDAIVNGIPGVRFIDGMKMSTSPGFPLTGSKDLYVTEYDGIRELDPIFYEQARAMEHEFEHGRRGYAIFKACLKDEPTECTKDKVRVFCGAPLAFQLLVRKYLLPVARILSTFPLISECAVGINARSPEWEEMSEHIVQKGQNRILAGDYSKYDLRMSSQLILTAFEVFIAIAREGNYTEREILVMKGIATEVAYPVLAYNGDLIGLHGSNPSGHNMTVYVNSVVNSLLCRCTFYQHYPTSKKFRDACSMMTYGDDFKGSVGKEYSKLNHLNHAKEMAKYGMGLTMPNKKDSPVKYSVEDGTSDVDFLKRVSNYIPEIECTIGKLAEDSIFKSLHNNMKSRTTTEREICASVVDSALCEWVAYGKRHYTKRHSQMKQICEKVGISHMVHFINHSFDDHVEEWKHKYRNTAEPEVVPPPGITGR